MVGSQLFKKGPQIVNSQESEGNGGKSEEKETVGGKH